MKLFKRKKLLWVISSLKYTVKLEFNLNFIEKWIFERAFNNHKVKIIKNSKIRGFTYDSIYVDEI